jgi:YHS domain-containing protein
MRLTRFIAVLMVPFMLLLAGPASADKVYSSWGTAIDGYDAVAYFNEGKPVEGDSEFSHDWNGATWHFSSAGNRDLFAADPEKYAPQYGGYCAYAVSQGYTASTEPDAWSIVDGKLYLNYSKSVQSKWEQNTSGYIKDADTNWPGIESGL